MESRMTYSDALLKGIATFTFSRDNGDDRYAGQSFTVYTGKRYGQDWMVCDKSIATHLVGNFPGFHSWSFLRLDCVEQGFGTFSQFVE